MKKKKSFFKSPAATIALFGLAVALLAFASIGGARAALTYFSETYTSRVQMYDIGVSLLENGERVSYRDYNSAADGTWDEATGVLLGKMLATDEDGNVTEKLKVGKKYDETLSISNSGTINHYARVTIYKYWLDKDGNKMQNLSPDLIDLNLTNLNSDWLLDETSSTPERTVLYYRHLLPAQDTLDDPDLRAQLPSGANDSITSAPFTDTLKIDNMIATKVTQTTEQVDGGTKITTVYDYDGISFHIEATVDAVQEHNAEDAILSAWGRHVTISDGTLSLQ